MLSNVWLLYHKNEYCMLLSMMITHYFQDWRQHEEFRQKGTTAFLSCLCKSQRHFTGCCRKKCWTSTSSILTALCKENIHIYQFYHHLIDIIVMDRNVNCLSQILLAIKSIQRFRQNYSPTMWIILHKNECHSSHREIYSSLHLLYTV